MTEEWKDIEGYENIYQVSNMGRVRSFHCDNVRILKQSIDKKGYKVVNLRKDGRQKQFFIHRLVAMTFILNPNEYPIINHKDENPSNNRVDNLEWCDIKYNINYGTCIQRRTEKQLNRPDLSKSVLQYTKDGHLIKEYPSISEAERQTGINQGAISSCCIGKKLKNGKGDYYTRRSAGGYVWRFKD